jgi:cell division protein FtsA
LTKFKFLRSRREYYRHFTVLDIGTDLIKVLVVRRDGPDGEVLGVGREPQAPAAMSGGAIADLESVIQSCNRALEAAEDMAKTVPGQVVVGIAGELIKGFSSTIAYPRENSKSRVRSGEISTMLQMVQRRALREAQHLLELERSYGQLEARLVHSAITNVRVDGYPVTNPVGFTGKNLEVTVSGRITAPLTPITARMMIRPLAVVIWLATTDETPKRTSAIINSLRRPSRSPSTPAGSMKPASERV